MRRETVWLVYQKNAPAGEGELDGPGLHLAPSAERVAHAEPLAIIVAEDRVHGAFCRCQGLDREGCYEVAGVQQRLDALLMAPGDDLPQVVEVIVRVGKDGDLHWQAVVEV